MISTRNLLLPAFGLFALVIAACGGGGSSRGNAALPVTTPVAKASSNAAQQVTMHVVIPSAASANLNQKLKRRFGEAQSTQGLQVAIYPNPQGTSSPVINEALDISSSSPLCALNSDQSRSCNFPLSLAPGSYIFALQSYDQPPSAGVIPGTASELGLANFSGSVSVGGTNAFNISMNGVAASVNVSLPLPIVHTVNSVTEQATVAVLDADNDIIVANTYVDTNGNTDAVALASNSSLVTWGTSTISAPSTSGYSVTWNPAAITSAQMTGGVTATLTATLSSNSATSTATLTAPAALQDIGALNADPSGITAQTSTSTLWVAEPSSNTIQSIVPASSQVNSPITIASSPPIGATPGPSQIFYAPDGNLWLTFANVGAYGHISTSGTGLTGTNTTSTGGATSIASDGTYIWMIEPSGPYLDYTPFTPLSATQWNPVGVTGLFQIVQGTGSTMWWTASTANLVGTVETSTSYAEYSTFLSTGAAPAGIAWDGNSTMYIAESGLHNIAKIVGPAASATVAEYPIGGSVVPEFVVVGPDGNAWFDYSSPTPGIGRMTPSGTMSLFPLPSGTNPGPMVALGTQVWLVDLTSTNIYGIYP